MIIRGLGLRGRRESVLCAVFLWLSSDSAPSVGLSTNGGFLSNSARYIASFSTRTGYCTLQVAEYYAGAVTDT